MTGLAASMALLLTACGMGTGTTSTPNSTSNNAGTTQLSVGTSPAILNASLYHGEQSGIFAKHNLKVTPKVVASGAEAIPLLLNGQIQFAASDPVAVITSLSKNIPLTFVAPAGGPQADTTQDFSAVLADPSINSAADLNGKTVAVNAIGGILQVAAKASIDLAGGDSGSVKFVTMSISQMAAAVKGGQVDAAVVSEPFLALGVGDGLKNLLPVVSKAAPNVPTVVYVTSKSYADSNPEVVKNFAAALLASNADLDKDPAKIRSVAVGSTQSTPEVMAKVNLPEFMTEPLSLDALNELQDLMIKYQVVSQEVDLSTHLYTPGS
ncbi:ABC transporter substrate-binding protein [Nonomuraea antimicrobica]|uniref:ABC transporter substrate-binding protein n=1 Tax=Nonomuraea antimicrobica TaxID=561173 RepID=A0ABP7E5W1_9ACTN